MDNPAEVIRVPGAPADKKAVNILGLDQFPRIHVVDAAAVKDGDPIPGLPAVYLPQRLPDYRMHLTGIPDSGRRASNADGPDRLIGNPYTPCLLRGGIPQPCL